jgi:hypothetical protein
LAASVAADQPRAEPVARPSKLLKVAGTIEAFAQDRGRVAADAKRTASGGGCRWSLHVSFAPQATNGDYARPERLHHGDSNLQLVLAGRVAAWRRIQGARNLELDADVWTAVAGSARAHRMAWAEPGGSTSRISAATPG